MNKPIALMTLTSISLLFSITSVIGLQYMRVENEDLLQKISTLEKQQRIIPQSGYSTDTNYSVSTSSEYLSELQTQMADLKQQLAHFQALEQTANPQTPAHSNDTLSLVENLRSKTYLTKDDLNSMTEQSKKMNKEDNKLYLETLFAKLGQDSFEIYDSEQK